MQYVSGICRSFCKYQFLSSWNIGTSSKFTGYTDSGIEGNFPSRSNSLSTPRSSPSHGTCFVSCFLSISCNFYLTSPPVAQKPRTLVMPFPPSHLLLFPQYLKLWLEVFSYGFYPSFPKPQFVACVVCNSCAKCFSTLAISSM